MSIQQVLDKPTGYGHVDYDGLWKKIIQELFEEFVLFFMPYLYEDIDFAKEPDFLQQELFQEIIQEKKSRQVADQIVKVFLKNGEEKWLLIHIEVQGDRDPDFSIRMFRYYYRIFDFHHEDVVTLAILTDDLDAFRPNQYKRSSYGTKLIYEFNMAKLVDYSEEELLQSAKPFAIAVLAAKYANEAKKDDQKRYRFKRKLFRLVLQSNNGPQDEPHIFISTHLLHRLSTKNPTGTYKEIAKGN